MLNTVYTSELSTKMGLACEESKESKHSLTTSQVHRSARKSLSLKKRLAEKLDKSQTNLDCITDTQFPPKNNEIKTVPNISTGNKDFNDSCFDESDFQAIDELIFSGSLLGSETPKKSNENISNEMNPMKKQRKSIEDSGIAETSMELTASSILETSLVVTTQSKDEGKSQITSDVKSVLLSNAQAPANLLSSKQKSGVLLSKMMDMNESSILNESINLDATIDLESSIMKIEDKSFYGLPASVKQLVHDFKGIEDLYCKYL